jgi:hypothetical protein
MKIKLINKDIDIHSLTHSAGVIFGTINFIVKTQGIEMARIYWKEMVNIGLQVDDKMKEFVEEALRDE